MSEKFDLTLIPAGPYCYHRSHRDVCSYWERRSNGDAFCRYLNLHSEFEGFDNFVWDQVKECGVNE
jgi:hypothetical protein